MFAKMHWKKEIPRNEMHIHANPDDKETVQSVLDRMEKGEKITLVNPVNNRSIVMDIRRIESIETYDGSSIVKVAGEAREYMIPKRLKELEHLGRLGLLRVSNSVMLNVSHIQSFEVIGNARLEVETKGKQKYIVSRHYASRIKEELSCLSN